jgi:hypothetical protein
MKLPIFQPTQMQKEWVQSERKTAAFIRAFWSASSVAQRRTAGFLWFLTASAWTNITSDSSDEASTREWRNRILAEYLGVHYETISGLAQDLCRAFPRFTPLAARRLLATYTGITHFYTAVRPRTRRYVARHSGELFTLFDAVSSRSRLPEDKIRWVTGRLSALPWIKTPGGHWMSPFNPLSPVLACLDPHRRFPIMNQRTARLLGAVGQEQDGDGAIVLYALIGSHNIHDSFELDVYSQDTKLRFPRVAMRNKVEKVTHLPRLLSVKSEIDSFARLAERRVRIRREHNKLTNRFRRAVFANVAPQESRFDLLVDGWRPGRKLLIEAKTDWRGATGRMQIRQAIGQLFDYRKLYFRDCALVDLAILVPTKPASDIIDLLKTIGIAVLWFHGPRLSGTIAFE